MQFTESIFLRGRSLFMTGAISSGETLVELHVNLKGLPWCDPVAHVCNETVQNVYFSVLFLESRI